MSDTWDDITADVADPERIAAELAETGGRLLKAACELRSL